MGRSSYENHSWKKSNRWHFWFFWCYFCHPSRVLRWLQWGGVMGRGEVWGWLGWWKLPWFSSTNFFHCNRRTIEFAILCLRPTFLRICFRFFWPWFLSSSFPPSQSQNHRIRNIASSSNIFENLKFSKMFDEDAISRIRGSGDCDGREGVDDENCGRKKSKITKSVGFSLTFAVI